MFERIKLFPVLMAVLIAFLGLRGLDLWLGVDVNVGGIGQATASEAAKGAEPVHPPVTPRVSVQTEDRSPLQEGHEGIDQATRADYLSAADVDIMNSMEDRSVRFEEWQEDLKIRENMLIVAEKKVEAKIGELRELEATLKRLVGEQSAREQADLLRLVKVYENMKAKSAAPILEKLDGQTRLSIASRMRAVKLAAILPFMSKPAAQELTIQMMNRSEMPREFVVEPQGPEL